MPPSTFYFGILNNPLSSIHGKVRIGDPIHWEVLVDIISSISIGKYGNKEQVEGGSRMHDLPTFNPSRFGGRVL